jgi:Domain of unknown function (DUF4271)
MKRFFFLYLIFNCIQAVPLFSQDSLTQQTEPIVSDSISVKTFQYPQSTTQLKPETISLENGLPKDNEPSGKSWIFVVFFLQAVLIASIRYIYHTDYFTLFRSTFNLTFAQQRFRDMETIIPFSSILLNLNLYLSLSFIAYFLFAKYYSDGIHGFGQYGLIFMIIVFIDLIRKAVVIVLSLLLNFKKELLFLNFNTNLLLKVFGIVVMPVLFIAAFIDSSVSNYFVIVTLFLFLTVIFFKYFKATTIIKPFVQSYLFYIIIYICTLELAPVFFLVKLFKIYF